MRQLTILDKCFIELDNFIKAVAVPASGMSEKSPADNYDEVDLCAYDIKKSSSLMRVDHTGEVCAQALYRGQAFVAKNEETRVHLYEAAAEECNHLSWCEDRLTELGARKSILNSFWYIKSFAIGATAGLISDQISYGFIMETENQVMDHLQSHLVQLPSRDVKSKAILEHMYKDEKEHAIKANDAGGVPLPGWAKLIMKAQSKIMTTVAYRI